jgi:hypothetical protein
MCRMRYSIQTKTYVGIQPTSAGLNLDNSGFNQQWIYTCPQHPWVQQTKWEFSNQNQWTICMHIIYVHICNVLYII